MKVVQGQPRFTRPHAVVRVRFVHDPWGEIMYKGVRIGSLLVGVVLQGGVCLSAWAVDGVVLIDQSRALSGGVTPGDAPGFPVTITLPGSYRLAGNLTVPDENTSAIEIAADEVSLDLNGFAIRGPTVCVTTTNLAVSSCSPTGTGSGVKTIGFPHNVAVSNGTVRGMGSSGIVLNPGRGMMVDRVRAESNGVSGIFAGEGLVTNSVAVENGFDGIGALGGSVNSCYTFANGNRGISNAGMVRFSSAEFNGGVGLDLSRGGYIGNYLNGNYGGSVGSGVSLGQNICNGVAC